MVQLKILPTILSPHDLRGLSLPQLERLAAEMREVLCNLVSCRSAHFASNLGVVELCLALHQNFDFSHDRLIWDTGHQIYPHKLITGRYPQFDTMRTRGGLMGSVSMGRPNASPTAFATHAGAPMVADSPMPLNPCTVFGDRVSRCTTVTRGASMAVGIR